MSVIKAKKLGLIILLFILFFTLGSLLAFSQGNKAEEDITFTAKLKSEVVNRVGKLLTSNYIFPETAKKMEDHLNTQLKEGKYDKITDHLPIS